MLCFVQSRQALSATCSLVEPFAVPWPCWAVHRSVAVLYGDERWQRNNEAHVRTTMCVEK